MQSDFIRSRLDDHIIQSFYAKHAEKRKALPETQHRIRVQWASSTDRVFVGFRFIGGNHKCAILIRSTQPMLGDILYSFKKGK